MEIELNVFPVAVGVCAYVTLWAGSKFFSRRRQSWALGKTATGASSSEAVTFEAGLSRLPESEPVPEPPPERAPESFTKRARVDSLAATAAVALGVVLLLQTSSSSLLALPAEQHASPAEQHASPRGAAEVKLPGISSGVLRPQRPAEHHQGAQTVTQSGDSPALPLEAEEAALTPVLRDQGEMVMTNKPLTVKLTRQTMDSDQHDYIRSAYYGTLMVGTPPEPFTVVFDTGSGHLVLPSTYCSSATCKGHKRYSRRMSQTGLDVNYDGQQVVPTEPRDQIAVSFGTGDITGVLVEDVICVGNMDTGNVSRNGSLAAQGQHADNCVTLRLIAATSLSDDPFRNFQFDGVLGMGLEGLSQAPEFNFMSVIAKTIQETGNGMSSTFGVFLAENGDEDSEIALGGWAEGHLAEELSWGPVHDPELGHWIVPVRRLRIDGEPLDFCEDGTCTAAVDTGTSLLAVPTAAFSEMYEGLRHAAPKAGHCQGYGPLLHIELEHFTVSLGPRDYARLGKSKSRRLARLYNDGTTAELRNTRWREDLRCIPMLMTLDLPEPLGPKLFILGEPVLRKYYTVFDAHRQRVGFGRAKHRQAASREELLTLAPELDRKAGLPELKRSPSMFDVFRWRKALL